jgi:hypothetical protein
MSNEHRWESQGATCAPLVKTCFIPGDPSSRKDMADPKGAKPWAELQKLMRRNDVNYT